MIPCYPSWPEVIHALHRSGLRDKDIFDKMAYQGVIAHHDALRALRTGDIVSPHYPVGAALWNVYTSLSLSGANK